MISHLVYKAAPQTDACWREDDGAAFGLSQSPDSPQYRRALALTDSIYELEQPWRDRFLTLIAERSGVGAEGDGPPPRHAVICWLCNQRLYRMIRLMLRTWTHDTR
jgi:hypothetical protein